jgi:hypothetical protein
MSTNIPINTYLFRPDSRCDISFGSIHSKISVSSGGIRAYFGKRIGPTLGSWTGIRLWQLISGPQQPGQQPPKPPLTHKSRPGTFRFPSLKGSRPFDPLQTGGISRKTPGHYDPSYPRGRSDRSPVLRPSRCEGHDKPCRRSQHGLLFYATHQADRDRSGNLLEVEPPVPADGRSCTPWTSWGRWGKSGDTQRIPKSRGTPGDDSGSR